MASAPAIFLTTILFLGIAAQWLAWRLRIPAILLLLPFGFAAGFTARWLGSGPDEMIGPILFPVVSLSVAVIMFEGGLSLQLAELRETGRVVFRLVTVGVLVTWILAGLLAWWLFDFEPAMAALLGALLVVSGPTVIVPMLRNVRPIGRLGSLVKWEGIVNDPIGAILAVLVFEVALLHGQEGIAVGPALLRLGSTLLAGALVGFIGARLLVWPMKRYWIPDYLHSPVFLAGVLAASTVANAWWQESGLVAVTLMGVLLANQKEVAVQHIVKFKENLGTLLISVLFIVLAARVRVDQIAEVGWRGLLLLAFLILAVRPLMVLASTWGSELNFKERLFLSWLHPRGIVAAAISALFALELTTHGAKIGVSEELLEQAGLLAPVTFLVIVGTVLIYGLTAGPLAQWLKLSHPQPQGILFAGAAPWVREIALAVQSEGFAVVMVDTSYANIAAARMAGLPTCYASILSEYVQESQDLFEIGRLLAMTPNDEVNTLATIEYADQFGRAEVYQLASSSREGTSTRHEPSKEQRLGRTLFAEDASYAQLAERFRRGSELRKTRLTEDFTHEHFRNRYGPTAWELFRIQEDGSLTVCTADMQTKPAPGQRLICLVDDPDEPKPVPREPASLAESLVAEQAEKAQQDSSETDST